MKYYILFDSIHVAISLSNIYLIHNGSWKTGDIAKNQAQVEIVEKNGKLSKKEEFEKHIVTNTPEDCITKMFYLQELKNL